MSIYRQYFCFPLKIIKICHLHITSYCSTRSLTCSEVLTCSLKLSRPSKTTPSSLDFDLSKLEAMLTSSLKTYDNFFAQVVKIVDDDLSAESFKFLLFSQILGMA